MVRAALPRCGPCVARRYHRAGKRCGGEVGGRARTRRGWWSCGWRRAGGVESLGGGERGPGLRGALLGTPEFGDGFGERGELKDEDGASVGPVAAEATIDGHEAGGAAKL